MQVGKGNLQRPLLRASRCHDRATFFLNRAPQKVNKYRGVGAFGKKEGHCRWVSGQFV